MSSDRDQDPKFDPEHLVFDVSMLGSQEAQKHMAQNGDSDRDAAGRFVKGHKPLPGAGRPRGSGKFNLMREARELAEKEELELGEAIGQVVIAMVKKAQGGDVQAARLCFDWLCFDEDGQSVAPLVVFSGVPSPKTDRSDRAPHEGV